jgi:eukaryotic-like serine/threonine-protein kinase
MEPVIKNPTKSGDRPQTPERLGKYPLLGLVGKGAMGVVYKSFDPHIRRPVALKTIRRDLLDEDGAGSFSARFRNEAQAAGRLLHPGIVAVYEYGEENDYAFIAMEYVEGSSLKQYFEQKVRFGSEDVISILAQLLEALQFAHERGVWHRDIKPANILIMSNGRIKVADFGIARVDSSTLTQIGAVMGTPGYIAPELYLSRESDCRMDVFAAGVVLYQLLAGSPPFSGSAENVMYKVCYETPVPPSVVCSDPSLERFDSIVLRAMAKRPEDRFSSAGQFRDALLHAHAQPVSPSVSEETIIRHSPVAPVGRDSHDGSSGHAGARSATSKSTAGQAASTATLEAAGWNMAELGRLEQQMARFIGPVARVLVRRAASESQDMFALVQRLAELLNDPAERANFLRSNVGRAAATTPPAASVPPGNDETRIAGGSGGDAPGCRGPTAAEINLASQRLAMRLGPIANVLVRRAAQPGATREQFVASLVAHLSDADDRARFLAELG